MNTIGWEGEQAKEDNADRLGCPIGVYALVYKPCLFII